ncbi:hypothetical protein ABK905_07535 [Acerihabitans sp. KWT182]|uniref:Uncharacterized protein n=1 Tax=Acerihabitans sp. KWT182 TaxID=3157919 RepID=A0AAU7QDB0_9GAMM
MRRKTAYGGDRPRVRIGAGGMTKKRPVFTSAYNYEQSVTVRRREKADDHCRVEQQEVTMYLDNQDFNVISALAIALGIIGIFCFLID